MRREWNGLAASACGLVALMVLLVMLLPACNGNGGEATPTGLPASSPDQDKVVITIGNLTDQTGVAATAMAVINTALDDIVDYFNREDLIPGVRLEVVSYDGQFDPSKDIPGYEWLREHGADLIFSSVPASVVTIRERAEGDGVVVFGVSGNMDILMPPGHIFGVGTIPQHEAFTLLKWIAENDWDYREKGPAKIGGAAWDESYFGWWMDAMQEYAGAHPEQFQWVGGYSTEFGFTWGPEVEALKDCDYVMPNNPMTTFVREYRDSGYKAKFIGASTHLSFLGMVDDADAWDEIGGMLYVCCTRWWNEQGKIIDLTNRVLEKYHPGSAEEIRRSGVGYIAVAQMYMMLDIIARAVDAVGPQGFDSQALYDAAQSYSLVTDGIERFSFGPEKRYAPNYYGIYTANAAPRDIERLDSQWYPTILEP